MNVNSRIRILMVFCLILSALFLTMLICRFCISSATEVSAAAEDARQSGTNEGIFYSAEGTQLTYPAEPGTFGELNQAEAESFAFLIGNQSFYSLRHGLKSFLYEPDSHGNGPDILMTVSDSLQNYAYCHVLDGREGSVIIADNQTGAILCLASHSDESLPAFTLAEEENSFLEQSLQIPGSQYIRGVYEKDPPGSTFKIITAAAALENQELDPDVFYYHDDGELIPEGSTYKVHNYNNYVFGDLDMSSAFMLSSNTYFANLALMTGWNSIQKAAEDFALNTSFEIPFFRTVDSEFSRGNGSAESLAMTGFGQGSIALTPMNLVLIAEAVANDGTAYSPYLIEDICHPGRAHLYRHEPQTIIRNDISGETYARIKDCLSQAAAHYGLPEGTYAKTGTAECADGNADHSVRIHTYILVFTDRYSFCISMNDAETSSDLNEPARCLIQEIDKFYDQKSNEERK